MSTRQFTGSAARVRPGMIRSVAFRSGAVAAAGVLLVALAGGCANGTGDQGGAMPSASSGSPPSGVPPISPWPSPSVPGTATPSAPASPPGSGKPTVPPGETEATGVVERGVEPGCTLLRTDTVLYLLVGPAAGGLRPGDRVVARGRPAPDLMTTCQQGEPFQVTDVRPA